MAYREDWYSNQKLSTRFDGHKNI